MKNNHCNERLVEQKVYYTLEVEGQLIVIENVPTGVCTECGTRYYSANVLKTIEETVSGRRKATREVRVPVYSL